MRVRLLALDVADWHLKLQSRRGRIAAALPLLKMRVLRVAALVAAANAFVATRANSSRRTPRHRREINSGTQVAPLAARRPVAVRGAPEDAADAKIDSFVKDNKVRVGVRMASRRRAPP